MLLSERSARLAEPLDDADIDPVGLADAVALAVLLLEQIPAAAVEEPEDKLGRGGTNVGVGGVHG